VSQSLIYKCNSYAGSFRYKSREEIVDVKMTLQKSKKKNLQAEKRGIFILKVSVQIVHILEFELNGTN
jgi:hypothetical protein